MSEICPYCLGLKSFCILRIYTNRTGIFLFNLSNWTFNTHEEKRLCSFYENGELTERCRSTRCNAKCPACDGSGKFEWLDVLFKPKPLDKPTMEDFKRLRDYFLIYGIRKYNLSPDFIKNLKNKE